MICRESCSFVDDHTLLCYFRVWNMGISKPNANCL